MQNRILRLGLSLAVTAILVLGGDYASAGTRGTAGTLNQTTSKKLAVEVNTVSIGLQDDGDWHSNGDIYFRWRTWVADSRDRKLSLVVGVTTHETNVEGVGDGNPVAGHMWDISESMVLAFDDNVCCDLGQYSLDIWAYDEDGSAFCNIMAKASFLVGLASGTPVGVAAGELGSAVFDAIGIMTEPMDEVGHRVEMMPVPPGVQCCNKTNAACTDYDNDMLFYKNHLYNGSIKNYWKVMSAGDCVSEEEADEPVPFLGDIKRVIVGQNGVGEFSGNVDFPEIKPLESSNVCVTTYLDDDNDPSTGAICGPEKGADNYYKVCGPDTTLTEEYGWWNPSVSCYPILSANFDSDHTNAAPDVSLPGGATNDQLTLNQSFGTIRVVSSAGNMLSKPLLISKNLGMGTVGFSGFVCSGAECDSMTVSWSSLTQQTTNATIVNLISSLGTTIATLQYGNAGQLSYNGSTLPISYSANVKQEFEIRINFAAQGTSLKINGSTVAGFQNKPFVQASTDFNEFKCQLSGTAAQQFAIDNILVCANGCGGWEVFPYEAYSVYVERDTTGSGSSRLHFSLNPSHFFGIGSIDSLGLRVISTLAGDVVDVSPHEDSAMIYLPWNPDSLKPFVHTHWITGDTTTDLTTGIGIKFSEPVTIPSGSVHIQPSVPFTYSFAYRTLKINFTPPLGTYTVSLDSTIKDGENNRLDPFSFKVYSMDKLIDTTVAERDSTGALKSLFSVGETVCIAARRLGGLPATVPFRAYLVDNDSVAVGSQLHDVSSDGFNLGTTDIYGKISLLAIGRVTRVGEFNTILDFNLNGVFDSGDRPAHKGWYDLYHGASCWTADPGSEYSVGDANGDSAINISDGVFLIAYIFSGGSAPDPMIAGDANCDGSVNISDAVYLIAYIFSGGSAPGTTCK